jgi:hypothetical protein
MMDAAPQDEDQGMRPRRGAVADRCLEGGQITRSALSIQAWAIVPAVP